MFDPKQQAAANEDGWRLVTTFNNGDTHPLWDIATFGPKFQSDRAACVAVIDAAKRGGAIHQQALKLVANSRMRPVKPKGKK
jgi:hypothetical protein